MTIRSTALASLPGVRHAFFTREGGVSEGAFASLNVGSRGGDLPERVAANRARAAARLGLGPDRLVTARQVHGATALTVAEPWGPADAPEADGLVTDRPGLLLGVLSADCGPLLMADPDAGVVAAAHAGWKGALGGVVGATVAAMAALGARPERIVAALGPCIAQQSYEVGSEFVASFAAADPESERFFRAGASGKALFDLKRFVAERLRRAGVAQVDLLPHDTCADAERFFSYRRSTIRHEDGFGLQLSAITGMP